MRKGEIQIDPSISVSEAPQGSLLALVETYNGGAWESKENSFFFAKLPAGERIKCLKITDSEQLESLSRRAAKWATDQSKKTIDKWLPTWAPYYTENKTLLAKVWLFSQVVMEKDFKNNHLNCLILARKCGPIFEGILSQINLASTNMLEHEAEEFDEAGNV